MSSSTKWGMKMIVDVLRLIFSLPFFIFASYQDYRERLVDNRTWLYLGIMAVLFDIIYFWELEWKLVFLIPSIIIFYEWFYNWKKNEIRLLLYFIVIVFLLYPFAYPPLLHQVYPFILIASLMLFIKLLHLLKVIRGRGDARALMLIPLLQPLYPDLGIFPIFVPPNVGYVQIAFPFLFLVLLYASFSSIGYFFYLLILNIIRGDFGFPEMFIGYRLKLEEIPRKHVWLMERIENGEHVLYIHPTEHSDEDLEKLREFGRTKVWVQPQIPFVVFITIGLILSYLLGIFPLLL